ncbi:MAG: Phosphate uptake regulator PhoU [Candidatus Methanohalarchaeum thermophilum]|uniref:Phosphate uptake regulator PhoU n=1 Tax=Methanohalarchaeum thermophilum TaxID=1903181 RepID=A0A1Q6DTZ1_METT1|nr:MAG: Phosphate uptake regulator PhoU [Candidatus Methanohalarchaeum thermophilum]
MESRKIYKSGGSTYVMSLPKEWVKKMELEEGDSIFLSKSDKSINIYPERGGSTVKKATIDSSKIPSPEALQRVVIAYYLIGTSTIVIEFNSNNRSELKQKIEKAINNLMGIELVEDIGDEITLEIFIDYKRMTLPKVLKRIYNIVNSMLNDLEKGTKFKKQQMIEDALKRENEVDKLYFLAIRELKYATSFQAIQEQVGIENARDVLGYRSLVKSLERISDHIEDIATDYIELMKQHKELQFSEEIHKLTENLRKHLKKAWKSRITGNINEYDQVFKNLEKYEKKLNQTREKLFQEITETSKVRKYTDIMISLSRIAQYTADMVEIEINLNTEKL